MLLKYVMLFLTLKFSSYILIPEMEKILNYLTYSFSASISFFFYTPNILWFSFLLKRFSQNKVWRKIKKMLFRGFFSLSPYKYLQHNHMLFYEYLLLFQYLLWSLMIVFLFVPIELSLFHFYCFSKRVYVMILALLTLFFCSSLE